MELRSSEYIRDFSLNIDQRKSEVLVLLTLSIQLVSELDRRFDSTSEHWQGVNMLLNGARNTATAYSNKERESIITNVQERYPCKYTK